MRGVVGVDLSTTATGVAKIEGGFFTYTATVKSKSSDWEDSYSGRHQRMTRTAKAVWEVCRGASLACIEGPSYGSHTSGSWDRAGLFWLVYGTLRSAGIPVAIVPPTARAKWVTNKGNANKSQVVAAVARLWPEVEFEDDNTADAMVLAAMGWQWMQLSLPVDGVFVVPSLRGVDLGIPEYQRKVITISVEWPAREMIE